MGMESVYDGHEGISFVVPIGKIWGTVQLSPMELPSSVCYYCFVTEM